MSRLMKKRQLVLSVMIVALAAAVFANWYYTKPKTTPVSGEEGLTVQRQEGDGSALNVEGGNAKLFAWYPGQAGGTALARQGLFGTGLPQSASCGYRLRRQG